MVDRLARDFIREFPATAGFSERNLYRMRVLKWAMPRRSQE